MLSVGQPQEVYLITFCHGVNKKLIWYITLFPTGSDFEFNEGAQLELVFVPGDERRNLTLSTFADNILEQDEVFSLELSTPDLDRPFTSQATFTIIDDDGRKCL